MKKFSFRLESVLRVRRIEEDIAKAKVLEKNLAADVANKTLEERRAAYETTAGGVVSPSIVSVTDVLAARSRAELSSQRLLAAEAALTEAKDAVVIAQQEFSVAAAKTKAISKLREKALEEFNTETLRSEQLEMDDLTNARKLTSARELATPGAV